MATPQCRYWVDGRGCKRGNTCPLNHDQAYEHLNVCHKFQRGRCYREDCCGLHTEERQRTPPEEQQRTPQESMIDFMTQSLRDQLLNDIRDGVNTEQRAHQFKTFYERQIHPDKWTLWPDMEHVNSEVFKRLSDMKERYLAGDPTF